MISIVLTNWYLIILIPSFVFVGSYLYTHRIPDVYAAKCQILLKSNETYDYQQQIYRGLGFTSRYASYEETASQMRVIQSGGLIKEVFSKLQLNVAYFIVGRLKVTEVYRHMPFMVKIDDRSLTQSGMAFNLNIVDTNSFQLSYELEEVLYTNQHNFDELVLENGMPYFSSSKTASGACLHMYAIAF